MPNIISVKLDGIPEEMRELRQWVMWRIEKRDGQETKLPYTSFGGNLAKSDDPKTWARFSSATLAYGLGDYSGIGFMFSADDPYCGIDLDGCRDPRTEKWADWARDIIKAFNTYTEVSPSGSGAKMFIKGKFPFDGGKKITVPVVTGLGGKKPGIEVYDKLRYFAMTGRRVGTFPAAPQPRQDVLNRYSAEWFKSSSGGNGTAIGEFYTPTAIEERAKRYISTMPIAISGSGGHNAAFKVACVLILGFDFSPDQAFPLFAEWSQKCTPPWSEREIRHKLDQADKQAGERGYLKNVRPERWETVRVPHYKAPQPPPASVTLQSSAHAYLDSLKAGNQNLVSLGLGDVDYAIGGGVMPAEMIVVAARPGHGKAQPLDASVLTPNGFKPIGECQIGDFVIGSQGHAIRVVGVWPQGEKPVNRIRFTDGTSTRCCDDHLWQTTTRNERRSRTLKNGKVRPTFEIAATVNRQDGQSGNHQIPVVKPIEFCAVDDRELPLDPYLLGLLIGDGGLHGSSVCLTNPERDIREKFLSLLPETDDAVEANEITLRVRRNDGALTAGGQRQRTETKKAIDSLGLSVLSIEKFIPRQYLFCSIESRLKLLAGLIDTDGHVLKEGTRVEFSTSSPRLAEDVAFLCRSLGMHCISESRIPAFRHKGERRIGHEAFRLYISFDRDCGLRLSEKHTARLKKPHQKKVIESVDPCGFEECVCITVDAEDGLYVTDDFILTHNSAAGLQISYSIAAESGPVLVISEEMSRVQLGQRAVQFSTKIPTDIWSKRHDDVTIDVNEHFKEKSPIFVVESCGTAERACDAIREHVEKEKIKCAVVDYGQMLSGKGKNRYEQMTDMSVTLRRVANEQGIVLILLAQMNRAVEGRDKFIPRMGDLRDSGGLEQDADVILFLLWPHRLNPKRDPKEYFVFVAKNRNRPINEPIIKCIFEPARQMVLMDKTTEHAADPTDFEPRDYEWDQSNESRRKDLFD